MRGQRTHQTTSAAPRWLSVVRGGLFVLLLVGIALGVGLAVDPSLAQVTEFTIIPVETGLGTADLREVVVRVIRWVLGILALVAVSLIIYGGILWMTSQGDTKKIQKAKRVITAAVVGLIIILISFALVTYVARVITNSTNDDPGGGGGPPGGCTDLRCANQFAIRSITTACGNPPNYREDVSRCSAIAITFNNGLDIGNESNPGGTVAAAITAGTLKIEKCTDANCSSVVSPAPAPIAAPVYSGDSATGTQAEWVTPGEGKSIVFEHRHDLFEPTTYYRVSIPKTLRDRSGRALSLCGQSPLNPTIPGGGCIDAGDHYEWIMQTGTSTDTERPRIVSTAPSSAYLTDPVEDPDQQVNRTPILAVHLSEAINPDSIVQDSADPAANTVVITEFSAPPNPTTGQGGTLGTILDPTDYIVVPNADNTGLEIQLVGSAMLKPFTWYQVTVQHLTDLCQNVQDPDPFTFVFETNNITPGVADLYPDNDYQFACPSTDVRVRFTVSMYDVMHSDCGVDPSGNNPNGGYVKEGKLQTASGTPAPGRQLHVEDHFPGGDEDPNNYCMNYAFTPASANLQPNTDYQVGVNTRYLIDDQGGTLNVGDLADDPRTEDWHFSVKPADQCADAPVITRLSPDQGQPGACFTIQGRNLGTSPSGNQALFNGSAITIAPPTAWSSNNIVAKVPTGQTAGLKPVQVRVDAGAPFGVLASNIVQFNVQTGSATGQRPACLYGISPDHGPDGTLVDLSGEGFTTSAPRKVLFTGSPGPRDADGDLSIPYSQWTDTFVNDAEIPDLSLDGQLSIFNGGGESNRLSFDHRPAAGTEPNRPQVSNTWPSCTAACINADIGARFTQAMDSGTFTATNDPAATVQLWSCTDDTCSNLQSRVTINTIAVTTNGNNSTLTLTNHATLEINKAYRVIILGTDTGVRSSGGEPLATASLNYTVGNSPSANAHSWTFKTKNDASACQLSSVDVQPNSPQTLGVGRTMSVAGLAYGSPDSCSTSGQQLNASNYTWSWASTAPAVASVSGSTSPFDTATGIAVGSATVTGSASGHSDAVDITVTDSATSCSSSSDCTQNGQCTGSICQNGQCTPLVKSVVPGSAPVGGWVTVNGCWFGSYGPNSRVVFTPSVDGAVPAPAQCGGAAGTWSNTQIIRAVPTGATNGPLQVIRNDLQSAASPASFTVGSGNPGPQICRLIPNTGRIGDSVDVVGEHLFTAGHTSRQSGDVVTFSSNQNALNYTDWQDQLVRVSNVPSGAVTGPVVVRNGTGTSNPLDFTVTGQQCTTTSCTQDSTCGPDSGCANDLCCAPAPRVIANSPDSSGVCRNVVMVATLGATAVDPSTVTNANVQVAEASPNGTIISTNAALVGNDIRITPSLLKPNTNYYVIIRHGVRSTRGVRLTGLNANLDGVPGDDAYVWVFSTGSSVCSLDRLLITPPTYTFYGTRTPGNTAPFTVRAIASNNQEIARSSAYNWNWGWSVAPANVVTIANSTTEQETATAVHSGTTSLIATALPLDTPVGLTAPKTTTSVVRVLECDVPWSAIDQATGTFHDSDGHACMDRSWPGGSQDYSGASCGEYNFALTYCRGMDNTTLLPDLNKVVVQGQSSSASGPSRLKQFLFTREGAAERDAIGLLVFDNSSGLSPQQWLERNQPGENLAGQTTTFDGYPAFRLGTSTYVAATQLDTSPTNTCQASNEFTNGSFENNSSGVPAGWTGAQVVRADTSNVAPGGGTRSVTVDATATTSQSRVTQDLGDASTARRDYRVRGWVRYKRTATVPNSNYSGGLITQCFTPDHQPDFTNCNPAAAPISFDRYGDAPGLFASTDPNFDTGWRYIDTTVSNQSGAEIGLRINCFASPGVQVWCDDIRIEELTACNLGSLEQNMYVLSINQNASGETQQIFDQILRTWQFNISSALSPDDRAAIARDTQRLGDLQSVKRRLDTFYSDQRRLPTLESGTFTPNVSTSKWFSWNATLGNALQSTLPTDPTNEFNPACTASGAYQPEASTCWSQSNSQFLCPAQSRLYGYRYFPGTCANDSSRTCNTNNDCPGSTCANLRYTLGTNLEYAGPGSLQRTVTNLCAGQNPSACSCFNYTFQGP